MLRLEMKGSPGAPSALPEATTSLGGFVSIVTTGADVKEPLSNKLLRPCLAMQGGGYKNNNTSPLLWAMCSSLLTAYLIESLPEPYTVGIVIILRPRLVRTLSKVTQLKSGREPGSSPDSPFQGYTLLPSCFAIFHSLEVSYSCLLA